MTYAQQSTSHEKKIRLAQYLSVADRPYVSDAVTETYAYPGTQICMMGWSMLSSPRVPISVLNKVRSRDPVPTDP